MFKWLFGLLVSCDLLLLLAAAEDTNWKISCSWVLFFEKLKKNVRKSETHFASRS